MGTFVRVMAALLVVAVLVGIGAGVYNAGVTAGLAEAAQSVASSGDPVVAPYWFGYGGPYWHGPGFFGIFFWILGIFLVFALLRVAFGWGRGGGRGPGGWGGGRREMMEEMHRDLHRRDASEGQRPATS
jgi:hypothetical protein